MLQQEEYGRHLKTSAKALLDKETAKNYSENVLEPISSYRAMGCNMSTELHFLRSHTDSPPPRKHGNFAKDSIRTFPKWKRGRVENGVETCGLTTAGDLQGRQQLESIRGKRRWSECLMIVLYSGHRACRHCSLCDTEYCN